MMLTAVMIAAALTLQVQVPTAHPSTWDGVPGSDVVQTDAVTGEVTFPMGQQPANALALGCVFGRSNVRCPKGTAEVVTLDGVDEPKPTADDAAANAFAWFAEGSEQPAATTIDWPTDALGDGTDGLPAGPIDCVTRRPVEGERACTFEEAVHNEYAARDAETARTTARTRPSFDEAFANSQSSQSGATADEPAAANRPGCRREEYRNPDGTGGGVRLVCGSGDRRTIDALRESSRPYPR